MANQMIKTVEETIKKFETNTISDLKSNKDDSKIIHVGDDIFLVGGWPTNPYKGTDKYKYHVTATSNKCEKCNNKKVAVSREETPDIGHSTWIEFCYECYNINKQTKL